MAEAMSQTERSLSRRLLVDPDCAKYKPTFSSQQAATRARTGQSAAKLAGTIKIIARAEKECKDGTKTKQNAFVLQQKKRLRHRLGLRIKDFAADIAAGA